MNRHTVQRTLFFSYFIPILLTIFLLSMIFFIYTSRVLQSVEESNLSDLTDKLISIIDSEISKMNNLSLNITNSDLLKEYIKKYHGLTDAGYPPESTEIYLASRDITNLLAMLAGQIKTVPQINFVDPGVLLIGAGTYNLIHEIPDETASALAGIDEEYGKRHFSGSIRDPLAEEAFPMYKNQEYISLFRTIFDLQNKQPIGIIEVKQFSESIFYGATKAPRNYMIFNSEHRQLFPPTVDGGSAYTGLLETGTGNGIFSYRNPESGAKEIISVGRCREINWTILNITEERNILKPVYRFLLIIIVSGAVMFLIGISVARRLSALITQSLSQLNGWISNLRWDNLSADIPNDIQVLSPLSEFEDIHQEFWKMNRKLHDSMKLVVQERTLQEHARMLALQSQMDPHFMYNMLATIGIMAEEGETANIVDTINHLTSILRYTASRTSLNVSLKEELGITESFLKCMKIRFGAELDYEIDADEALDDFVIPKLVLLPLAENSMKYATTGKPPWRISIRTRRENDRWELRVSDTGPGFSSEAAAKLEQIISCCDEGAENQLSFHFDGLGIPNIYSRMKIFLTGDLEFRIFNLKDSGACIQMGGPLEH